MDGFNKANTEKQVELKNRIKVSEDLNKELK